MADCVCDKADRIIELEVTVKGLEEDKKVDEAWRIRFEGKIDRILWAVIGLCITIILSMVGTVVTYGLSKL